MAKHLLNPAQLYLNSLLRAKGRGRTTVELETGTVASIDLVIDAVRRLMQRCEKALLVEVDIDDSELKALERMEP